MRIRLELTIEDGGFSDKELKFYGFEDLSRYMNSLTNKSDIVKDCLDNLTLSLKRKIDEYCKEQMR